MLIRFLQEKLRMRMCDCYYHKCENCGNKIDIHIEDFNYPRSDFKIWCQDHIDSANQGAVIFTWGENCISCDNKKGFQCAIYGKSVGRDNDGATLNCGADKVTEKIKNSEAQEEK